jgi:hypothetical protein
MDEIDKDCNLLEVIEQSLKARGIAFEKRQLLCGDRVRAAFVLTESKTVVDVIDQ